MTRSPRTYLPSILTASLLLSSAIAAAQQPPFEEDIRRFETEDAKNPPKKGGIVFVGSSSIRMWDSLSRDFPGHHVINRGFGGSQISDSVRNAHRIVTPYEPRMVVFFAGTNDLASGKSSTQVFADYRAFVAAVRSKLPNAKIAYLSITPAPSRWSNLHEVKRANALIRDYSHRQRGLLFVDMFDKFLTPAGGPRPELFIADQLHMNPRGYAIWAETVRPLLAP